MRQQMRRATGRVITSLATTSLLALSFHVCGAQATPLLRGGSDGKGIRFPKNSTLCVFIQADPKSQGRDQLLKEGVERWKKPLADRMLTLTAAIGNPPEGKANVILYRWVNDGILSNGMEIGPGKNDGAAQPITSSDKSKLVGGDVVIRNALPAGNDAQKNALRNAGEHELAHILGFADDSAAAVMKHEQTGAARDLNERDKKELNYLYGTGKTGGAGAPKGKIQKVGGGGGMGFFRYRVDFEPANAIADLDDPEHASLITFNVAPQFVTGLELPPGWLGMIPGEAVAITDPFFTEGYMLDGAGDPPPWDPFSPMSYVALRSSVEEAARDGLPAGFDPALTLDNLSFELTLFSPARGERAISVWAGGESQTVPGPFVPEPSSLLLFGSGALGLAGCRRRRR